MRVTEQNANAPNYNGIKAGKGRERDMLIVSTSASAELCG